MQKWLHEVVILNALSMRLPMEVVLDVHEFAMQDGHLACFTAARAAGGEFGFSVVRAVQRGNAGDLHLLHDMGADLRMLRMWQREPVMLKLCG